MGKEGAGLDCSVRPERREVIGMGLVVTWRQNMDEWKLGCFW